MQAALDQFRASIQRVRDLHALYTYFGTITTSAVDLSDLLRAQMVLCVSAMDFYIHELTRLGMIEIVEGKRASTPAFLRYRVSLDGVLAGFQPGATSSWLDTEVRAQHSLLSFQQADKVADAVRLISAVELWNEIGIRLASPAKDIKNRLQLIVQRRNKIAHEADIDPSFPGVRWPISAADVTTSINFIEQICETIHIIVA
jgi:hypothetical protein